MIFMRILVAIWVRHVKHQRPYQQLAYSMVNRLLMIFMIYIKRPIMVFVGGTVRVRLDRGSVLGSATICL